MTPEQLAAQELLTSALKAVLDAGPNHSAQSVAVRLEGGRAAHCLILAPTVDDCEHVARLITNGIPVPIL